VRADREQRLARERRRRRRSATLGLQLRAGPREVGLRAPSKLRSCGTLRATALAASFAFAAECADARQRRQSAWRRREYSRTPRPAPLPEPTLLPFALVLHRSDEKNGVQILCDLSWRFATREEAEAAVAIIEPRAKPILKNGAKGTAYTVVNTATAGTPHDLVTDTEVRRWRTPRDMDDCEPPRQGPRRGRQGNNPWSL
jgi:hypothetical protein